MIYYGYFTGAIISYLVLKIARWMIRIRTFRQTMPVVPVLFPHTSLLRKVFPRKWQTYHFDWYMHTKGTCYDKLNTDIFAMVSLFESDSVTIRDPQAYVEIVITDPDRFPKDLVQFKLVRHCIV